MPPKKPASYDNLNTRREDKCLAKADRLAEALTRELGVPVPRYTAVKIALEEAIERRKPTPKNGDTP